ncbi:MAG: hypothetical protein KDI46_00565 [Alphaproteobacteria bacterium]|nr:hypothetical protein [Alphaproteobacteria bacterium]
MSQSTQPVTRKAALLQALENRKRTILGASVAALVGTVTVISSNSQKVKAPLDVEGANPDLQGAWKLAINTSKLPSEHEKHAVTVDNGMFTAHYKPVIESSHASLTFNGITTNVGFNRQSAPVQQNDIPWEKLQSKAALSFILEQACAKAEKHGVARPSVLSADANSVSASLKEFHEHYCNGTLNAAPQTVASLDAS